MRGVWDILALGALWLDLSFWLVEWRVGVRTQGRPVSASARGIPWASSTVT
jgi:hypothetical protein